MPMEVTPALRPGKTKLLDRGRQAIRSSIIRFAAHSKDVPGVSTTMIYHHVQNEPGGGGRRTESPLD
jgi:hypothetical protein